MEQKDLSGLMESLKKIDGITHVLPFKDVLAINFDSELFPNGFTEASMTSAIKKVVHQHGFNMLTMETSGSKKIINLISFNSEIA